MERRKTRLSVIGISLILILSVIVAIFGVTNANTMQKGNSVSTGVINQEVDTVAATDSSKYIGGVDEYYMDDNSAKFSSWVAISNTTQLRQFLLNEGSYSGKNAYLTTDINDFSWDGYTDYDYAARNDATNGGRAAAGWSPRVALNRKLDGCGHTIVFKGKGTPTRANRTNVDVIWEDGSVTYPQIYANTNSAGYVTAYNKSAFGYTYLSNYCYAAFGGLAAALQSGGELKNFTFKIDSSHVFLHDDWGAYSNTRYKSVIGGLVGLQESGSEIDNVSVELCDGREIGVGRTKNAVDVDVDSTSVIGLVTGVSDGGTMTNVKSTLGEGSYVIASAITYQTNTKGPRSGVAYAGGVLGYAEGNSKIRNIMFEAKGTSDRVGGICAYTKDEGSRLPSDNKPKALEITGGIVASNTDDSQIESAMVSGNMNCMQTTSNALHEGWRRKGLFVAYGKTPQSEYCVHASGGTNKEGSSTSKTEGYYTDNQGDVIYVTADDINVYFDKTNKLYVNFQLFIPENRVVWQYGDQLLYDEMISGKQEDDSRRILTAPKASALSGSPKYFQISIGTIVPGKLGFYMRDPSSNIYDEEGLSWTEVSDQVRVDADKNPIPLYYNGTSYEIKLLANFDKEGDAPKLHDAGLTIRARGDLTNARSAYNGRPVTLYTRDSKLAYKDETKRIMVMLDKLDEGDLDKTLTIDKRYLGVTTTAIRGKTSIFDKATVTFEPIEDMENTGLAGNDRIKWQDTSLEPNADGRTIVDLNVAGRQMLRPSTNNYILMLKKGDGKDIDNYEEIGSYFATEIVAHTIEVDADVYINGEAIKPYSTREDGSQYGIYEVKNARTDKPTYNDTKRKLVVSVRVNDNHFNATRVKFYDASGNEVTTYRASIGARKSDIKWYSGTTDVSDFESWSKYNGLITTEIWINDAEIRSIRLEGRNDKTYAVTKNIDGKVTEEGTVQYSYGQRTTLTASQFIDGEDSEGNPIQKIFVGWQRAKDDTFISYLTNYSLKVVEDFNVNAVYEEYNKEEKPWTQEYYGKYGRKLRTRYVTEEEYTTPDAAYVLKESAGFVHSGVWTYEQADIDTENKVIKFHANFSAKADRPMVNIVWIDSEEHANDNISVDYGQPIVLRAGNSYLINNALIECDKDYTIYALTDMNIVENPTYIGDAVKSSIDYTSFDYKENGVGDYSETEKFFLAITFVYGGRDTNYGIEEETDAVGVGKPELILDGFDNNDITEYVRCGNVYQISMVITKQELECRFGPDSEITTTLQIVKEDGTKEQIGSIIIFRRKSTDTTGQGNRVS